MNINTAPKKAIEPIISPSKSNSSITTNNRPNYVSPNHNNTASSTPNIKYKSNQNQDNRSPLNPKQSKMNKQEMNGHTNSNSVRLHIFAYLVSTYHI